MPTPNSPRKGIRRLVVVSEIRKPARVPARRDCAMADHFAPRSRSQLTRACRPVSSPAELPISNGVCFA
jgi:hypothetical protein